MKSSWKTPFSQLSEAFDNIRIVNQSKQRPIFWTEEMLHRMPQHFYVWDHAGRMQCDCVVPIEKLHLITSKKENVRQRKPLAFNVSDLPDGFFRLYAADFVLWNAAKRVKGELCYTPMPFESGQRGNETGRRRRRL